MRHLRPRTKSLADALFGLLMEPFRQIRGESSFALLPLCFRFGERTRFRLKADTTPRQMGGSCEKGCRRDKKSLFRHEIEEAKLILSLPVGHRGGFSTSIASATGCCGVSGPKTLSHSR